MQTDLKPTYAKKWVLSLATILLAVGIQQFAAFPIHNAFTSSLNDWMHVPMFATITAVLLNVFSNTKINHVLLGLVFIALGSEALQFITGGEPSWNDLAKDALGAGIALCFFRPATNHRLIGIISVCAATLAVPCFYVTGNAYQYTKFPVLFQPEMRLFRILSNSRSNPTYTRDHNWQRYLNKPILALEWIEAAWPRVNVTETIGDWTQYETIVIDVYNIEATPQPLALAVHYPGLLEKQRPSRYQNFELQPGDNRLRASITKLVDIDDTSPLQIRHLMLNTTREHAGKRILLGSVWLE